MEDDNQLPPPGGGVSKFLNANSNSFSIRNRSGSLNEAIFANFKQNETPISVAISTSASTITSTCVTTSIASTASSYTSSSSIFLSKTIMSTGQNIEQNADNNVSKRKNMSPHQKSKKTKAKKQKTLKSYWLSAPRSSNQFDLLSSDDTDDDNNENDDQTSENNEGSSSKKSPDTHTTIPKPPPIYVEDLENISALTNALDVVAKNKYELKVLKNNEIKIQTQDSNSFSSINTLLKQKDTHYYTYKPKDQKGFKVVLRNMHYSTNKDDIVSELAELGHKVVNISNILQRSTKKPLSLFAIELASSQNNKTIYNVSSLLHCKISFEPPHHKREIPQCSNCQKYGHTKNYCNKLPVCVKCAGNHKTMDCKKSFSSSTVKCALCGGNHTANYKGCQIYKSLKIQRFPKLRQKEINNPAEPVQNESPESNTSYANVVKQAPQTNDMLELKEMFKQLCSQMATMMNILSMLVSKQNGV